MAWWGWVLVAAGALIVLVLAIRAVRTARRIDRLHRRVLSGRAGLNRQLVKRASEAQRTADLEAVPPAEASQLREAAAGALALAESGVVAVGLGRNPESRAQQSRTAEERLLAESMLTRAIAQALSPDVRALLLEQPVTAAQLSALDGACYRVQLARTLHNQDVALALALRDRPLPRVLHLAGGAALPEYVDLDDEVA